MAGTKHIIIGTAGHVDHGKTTLIQALTGTNTDRLKEEQERGMTIDLGFAALTLADGTQAGIVDVPGHERFIKNMLAGAAGVDVVLLVVAADESVMPQTIEHLDILGLLAVRGGVVALTKADLVEREWLAAVEDDVRSRLRGTFMEGAPVVSVNSLTGKGVPELKRALLSAASKTPPRDADAPFRMPVDRVFTQPGFGTIVTGTVMSGSLRPGEPLEAQPQGLATRARGLQTHNKRADVVVAGMRAAINLAGVEPDALARGAWVAVPGLLRPTQAVDVAVTLLPGIGRPLGSRARVRLYVGAEEVIGRVQVLGADQIAPGESGYVQFRAETPFACLRGDRIILRTYSPLETIGGGSILDAAPARRRRADAGLVEALRARERGTPEDLLTTWLLAAPAGAARREAARAVGLADQEAATAARALEAAGTIAALDGYWLIHSTVLGRLAERAVAALMDYHKARPLRPGMPREELRAALGRPIDPRAFAVLLEHWEDEGTLVADGPVVRTADFRIELSGRQQVLYDRVLAAYRQQAWAAPSVRQVAEEVGAAPEAVEALVRVGIEQGTLAKIEEGSYCSAETVEAARRVVLAQVAQHGAITVPQFRDAAGCGRRHAVAILEYLDSIGFTRRQGEGRVLVKGSE